MEFGSRKAIQHRYPETAPLRFLNGIDESRRLSSANQKSEISADVGGINVDVVGISVTSQRLHTSSDDAHIRCRAYFRSTGSVGVLSRRCGAQHATGARSNSATPSGALAVECANLEGFWETLQSREA